MNFADVTVVIPCFNAENTIERAVNSLVSQTLLPKKVFLINDCSTDGTLNILMNIKSNIHCFEVEVIDFIENKGPAYARNLAWNMSLTEYVAFLDADDAWHKNKINFQYGFMENNKFCLLSGHKIGYLNISEPNESNFYKISLSNMIFKNYFNTPSVMLRRVLDLRFDENKRYSEDYKLWLRVISKHPNSVYYSKSNLGFLFKPSYGYSGLSSNLWLMQKGEIDNFNTLYNEGYLSLIIYFLACFFSYLKFIKRFIFTIFMRF